MSRSCQEVTGLLFLSKLIVQN